MVPGHTLGIMAQDVNVYEIFEYSIVWDVYVFTC